MPIPVVCPSCKTTVNAPDATAGKKARCPGCQAVFAVPDIPTATAVPSKPAKRNRAASSPTSEKVFLQEHGIKITNARIVFPGQTYSVANITSVRVESDHSSRSNLILVSLAVAGISALFLFAGRFVYVLCAVVGIGIAGLMLKQAANIPKKYIIVFSTSGSEQKAFFSTDKALVLDIVDAINDAIIAISR